MIGQGVGALSTLLLAAIGWLVGVRLLLLAKRTRRAPELCLGLGIFLIGGIAYPLAAASNIMGESAPNLAWLLAVASATASHIGVTANCIFNWKVFRPASRWPRLAVTAAVVATLIGFAGNLSAGLHGGITSMADKRGWTLFLMAIALGAFSWAAVESFLYHDKLRRRLALGMADPVVVDRFRLWGISSAASATGCLVVAFFAWTSPLSVMDPVALVFSGASSVVSAVVMTLTFMPPAGYLRFIQTRHATSAQ